MGRRSAQHLALIGPGGLVPTIRRPTPPAILTAEEQAEWKAIVNRMPADWFPRETHPMLVQLCRAIVRSHQVAKMIDRACAEHEALDHWQKLMRIESAVSEQIARLSTKMRITQQSSYDVEKRKGYTPKYDPWTGLMKTDEAEEKEAKPR